ncbi:hypothetical protein NPIL_29521 [Nephila pilipes]|uniref:Uncharacterized protein n=1 Tax=Nephila pilipes TaxID=299642 RepID=A0A8X6NI57_NEPPI|nr:hypothetical protein NPIL_29521 [Nephila pilipes]
MITIHHDPLEQYLDSQVPELKEESPSRVTDVGLLESSSQKFLEKRKVLVCADTGVSCTIAGEKLFKFLEEHGITFENKIISFKMVDGIRQSFMALSTINLCLSQPVD